MATTANLLHERGYSALSVADICADAGLKKGSFYHFFPSKRDLVLATIDHIGVSLRERLERSVASTSSPREQLEQLFAQTGKDLRQSFDEGAIKGCPLGNLALEMAHRDEAIRAKLHALFEGWRTVVESVLIEGVRQGEFDIDDPESVAGSLIALMQGATMLAKASNDPSVFDDLAGNALALVDRDRDRPSPVVAP